MSSGGHEVANDDLGVSLLGDLLAGKHIALAVGGGIAAIDAPKIARQLRRYGASVRVYASRQATKFIGEAALQWGCAKDKVISEFSGDASHVVQEDLLLIAPMTASLASKISHGIADSPVSALAASALGSGKSIIASPSMHQSLGNNPFHKENIERLKRRGVLFVPPALSEGKLKQPSPEEVVAWTSHHASNHPLRGGTWLITGGGVPSKIDAVRSLNNHATGKTAVELARQVFLHGGRPVLLIPRQTHCNWKEALKPIRFSNTHDYRNKVMQLVEEFSVDFFVSAAAVSDYGLVGGPKESKLRSDVLELTFKRNPKIVEQVKRAFPSLPVIVFKYEPNLSLEALLTQGRTYLKKGYDGVLLNPVPPPNPKGLRGLFMDRRERVVEVSDNGELFSAVADGFIGKGQ